MQDEFFDDSDLDEYDDYDALAGWEMIAKKSVLDYDGFSTDYSLWHNWMDDTWICIFGDVDFYNPSNSCDAEFDNEAEAHEWFDSYTGFDDDDIMMSTEIAEDSQPLDRVQELLQMSELGLTLSQGLKKYAAYMQELDRNPITINGQQWFSLLSDEQLEEIDEAAVDLENKYYFIRNLVHPNK